MVGCVTLVKNPAGHIIGIKCKKNRGVILPGGKWEKGESYVRCAEREFMEETGLSIKNLKLVFWGESEEGYFTYAFIGELVSPEDYEIAKEYGDEDVVNTCWEELTASRFGGFYELMQQVVERREFEEKRWANL